MRTATGRVSGMKIAFVYDAIYPYVKGGVEKRIWELAVRLSRKGHEVHLFGMKFWAGDDLLIREGVYLHGVSPAQKLYAGGRRSIWQPLWFSICLTVPLMREKCDIIDCQQFPYFSCISAGFVSRIRKIPLTITWIEVWGDYWYEYIGKMGFLGKLIEQSYCGIFMSDHLHFAFYGTSFHDDIQQADRCCYSNRN